MIFFFTNFFYKFFFFLKIDEAIDWSKKVLEINRNNLKANILYGCSLIKKAHLEKHHSNKMKYFNEALEAFKKYV